MGQWVVCLLPHFYNYDLYYFIYWVINTRQLQKRQPALLLSSVVLDDLQEYYQTKMVCF